MSSAYFSNFWDSIANNRSLLIGDIQSFEYYLWSQESFHVCVVVYRHPLSL